MNTQLALARRGDRALLGIFDNKDQALASAWLSPSDLKALATRATEIAEILTATVQLPAELTREVTCERCDGTFLRSAKGKGRYCESCRPIVVSENGRRNAAKKREPAAVSPIAETASQDAPPSISVDAERSLSTVDSEPAPSLCDSQSEPSPLELAKRRNRSTLDRLRERYQLMNRSTA